MDKVRVLLIANAGILIEHQGQQLLVDALHEGHRLYPGTPPEAVEALLDGRPPFKTVTALAFTHNHIDHFSAQLTLAVMQRHSGIRVIADEPTAEALTQTGRDMTGPFDASRITTMPWQLPSEADRAAGAYQHVLPEPIEAGPFRIQPIPFEHEGQRFAEVVNVGLMITVGGLNILYPGDARMSPENFAILENHLPPVDVAVVMFPYIATTRGQKLVREVIRPVNLIAVHWPDPARDRERLSEHARRYFERHRDTLMPTAFFEHYLDAADFERKPDAEA